MIGNILSNTCDIDLVTKMCKEFSLFNSKKNNLIKNKQKIWIDFFIKETCKWTAGIWKGADTVNHQGNANQNNNELSPHTC